MTAHKKSFWQQISDFIPQVKQEVAKVTWPTRRETGMTTVVVFIFAVIAALYFVLVDKISFTIMNFILDLGA